MNDVSTEHGLPAEPSRLAIVSSMFIGTVALMVLGVQPILFGALVEDGRLSESALGLVGSIETLALALGAMVGPWFLRRGGMKLKTAVIAALLTAANLAMFWAKTALLVFVLRGVAGFGEGMLLSAAIVVLTFTRHPERMNALFLAVGTVPQVFAAYLLPVTLLKLFGPNAGFGLLAGLAASAILVAFTLPDQPPLEAPAEADAPRAASGAIWTAWVIVALAAMLLTNTAIGSAWNYLEQMAAEAHLGPGVIGTAVAGTLTFQVIGSLGVAWVGWKLDYRVALVGGCLLLAADTLALSWIHAPGAFIALACLFGLLWLALAPFLVKLAIELDPTRRVAMVITPVILIGLSLGPLVGSVVVGPSDVSGAYRLASAIALASALLYGLTIIAAIRNAGARKVPAPAAG